MTTGITNLEQTVRVAIVGGIGSGCLFLVVIAVLLMVYVRRKRYVHDAKESCFNRLDNKETVLMLKVDVCRKTLLVFLYLLSLSIPICCHYRFWVFLFAIRNRMQGKAAKQYGEFQL